MLPPPYQKELTNFIKLRGSSTFPGTPAIPWHGVLFCPNLAPKILIVIILEWRDIWIQLTSDFRALVRIGCSNFWLILIYIICTSFCLNNTSNYNILLLTHYCLTATIVTVLSKFRFQKKNGSRKNFLWVPRLWVGRR